VSRKKFGNRIRALREKLLEEDREYSLRRFAARVGMSPTYLSKVERGDLPPPGEQKVKTIAKELGEDPDELLALAGRVASDIPEIVRKRPVMMAKLIRRLRNMEDKQIERIFRIVEDGDW
jgi:transcriptional regulator with XRE-family HTH domain